MFLNIPDIYFFKKNKKSYFSTKVYLRMITKEQFDNELQLIIENAIREDVGDGDHSSLACIPAGAMGKAKLLVKDEGILAGVEFAKMRSEERRVGKECRYTLATS